MPEIFQLDFMVRAFIAGGAVGVSAPVLGTFLVLQRLSLIAETLSHVAITGAAIGIFLGEYPVLIAMAASVAAAITLERLRTTRWLASDGALALVLYTALAIALVLISRGDHLNVSLLGYLFGNVVTVTSADVWAAVAAGALTLLVIGLLYSEFLQATFDADMAKVAGVPVHRVNLLLAILTGVTVTLSMRVVGGLLVGALIVLPVLAALQLKRAFRTTLLVAAAIGAASVFIGLTVSYYQDIAASGAIVLTALAMLTLITGARTLLARKTAV